MADTTTNEVTLGAFLEAIRCIHAYPDFLNRYIDVQVDENGTAVSADIHFCMAEDENFTDVVKHIRDSVVVVNDALASFPQLQIGEGDSVTAILHMDVI